ncbi:hypothetical protein [Sphingobacterium sp. BIGb0165]|uniref:hypothetical protein n=1 Tax=Sphingobacterium sp. BIGb0165 TaxID=2940615 RepID=UPI00216A8A2A|nr:hypothetical protein [Sphingobacterium sp. BIGb0165]MCS4227558.1 hypothetical protein [Sphingobacterium sp. BIGb0165]
MMNRSLLVFSVFFLFLVAGCEKSEESGADSKASILFSDNNHAVRGKVTYDYNLDNCGQINLITAVKEDNGDYAELKLTLLQNGALAKVQYLKQNSPDDSNYFAPHLQTEKSFKITDFKYDKKGGRLSFSFDGKVFKNNKPEGERILAGKVELNSIQYAPCKIFIFDVMTVNPAFNFFAIPGSSNSSANGSGGPDKYKEFAYNIYSNAGQFLSLRLGRDISKLVGQEIAFDEENKMFSVQYWEYIGPYMLSESYGPIDRNWKRFQTRGKLVNIQKMSDNRYGKPYYSGLIIMDIFDEDRMIKQAVELPFHLSSWLD